MRTKKTKPKIERNYFIEFSVGMPITIQAENSWEAILKARRDGYEQPIERITDEDRSIETI